MEDRLKQLKADKLELQNSIEKATSEFQAKYPEVRFEIDNSLTWYYSPMNNLYQITRIKTKVNIEI